MKKALSFFLSVVLTALLVGCGSSNENTASKRTVSKAFTDNSVMDHTTKPTTEPQTETTTEDVSVAVYRTEKYSIKNCDESVLKSHVFNDGVAWANLKNTKDYTLCTALIDKTGTVLYFVDEEKLGSNSITTSFINGVSAVYSKGKPDYVIVDKTGEEVYSSFGENMYMCGQAYDGKYIIAQKESGFEKVAWHFFVLDSSLNLFETGIEAGERDLNPSNGVKLFADDIYLLGDWMLNLNNNSFFFWRYLKLNSLEWAGQYCVADINSSHYLFEKDIIKNVSSVDELVTIIKNNNTILEEKYAPNDRNCKFNLTSWKGNSLQRYYYYADSINKCMDYIDINGQVIYTCPSFPNTVRYDFFDEFSGDFCALYLIGADGNLYATLSDEKSNLNYDPIVIEGYEHCSFNGYIFLYSKHEKSLKIINPHGELIGLEDDLSGLAGTSFIYNDENCSLGIGDNFILVSLDYDTAKYYSLNNKNVVIDTITADFTREGDLIYTDQNCKKHTRPIKHNSGEAVTPTKP